MHLKDAKITQYLSLISHAEIVLGCDPEME